MTSSRMKKLVRTNQKWSKSLDSGHQGTTIKTISIRSKCLSRTSYLKLVCTSHTNIHSLISRLKKKWKLSRNLNKKRELRKETENLTKKQLRRKRKRKSYRMKKTIKMKMKNRKTKKRMEIKKKRSNTKYSTIQNKLKEHFKNKKETHLVIFLKRKTPF